MFANPPLGVVVGACDVLLELDPLDAPLTAAADLDRRQLSVADQRVDLSVRGRQLAGDVLEQQEAGGVRRICHGGRMPDNRACASGTRLPLWTSVLRCCVLGRDREQHHADPLGPRGRYPAVPVRRSLRGPGSAYVRR
jgi:hypothetical protein